MILDILITGSTMGKPKKDWAHKYLNDELDKSESAITSSSNVEDATLHAATRHTLQLENNFNEDSVPHVAESVTINSENKDTYAFLENFQVAANSEIASSNVSNSPLPALPLRPVPTYNCGRDLSNETQELDTAGPVPTLNYRRDFIDRRVDSKVSEWPSYYNLFYPPVNHHVNEYKLSGCEVDSRLHVPLPQHSNASRNFDPINYVTNHLSNIEITRIQAIENISNEDSNSCASNTFSTGDSTSSELPISTNDSKRHYVPDVTQVNATLNCVSPKSKNNTKQKKPRIRKG